MDSIIKLKLARIVLAHQRGVRKVSVKALAQEIHSRIGMEAPSWRSIYRYLNGEVTPMPGNRHFLDDAVDQIIASLESTDD